MPQVKEIKENIKHFLSTIKLKTIYILLIQKKSCIISN